VKVIAVANFWVDYFSKKITHTNQVHLFPNLFDTPFYAQFRAKEKKKRIHLGQYLWKNDPAIFALAARLNNAGYDCYFSTNDRAAAARTGTYAVVWFEKFDNYLRHMAESEYTLALTNVNEGWNRVAHESILVGTTVVGYDRGGLGELLKLSGSVIVKDAEEAFNAITGNAHPAVRPEFITSFDAARADHFIDAMMRGEHGRQ
jgi:hypothetical protein